ncbi:hypothetical protein IID62_01640 [candidate division KSB1 bacterium]|nr:hypothetical protein [candidate division KSB1 bacterium]
MFEFPKLIENDETSTIKGYINTNFGNNNPQVKGFGAYGCVLSIEKKKFKYINDFGKTETKLVLKISSIRIQVNDINLAREISKNLN